jgi:ABC-type uncharacterized transport system ATPase subunit
MTSHEVKGKINFWLEKFEIVEWKNIRIVELSKGFSSF